METFQKVLNTVEKLSKALGVLNLGKKPSEKQKELIYKNVQFKCARYEYCLPFCFTITIILDLKRKGKATVDFHLIIPSPV